MNVKRDEILSVVKSIPQRSIFPHVVSIGPDYEAIADAILHRVVKPMEDDCLNKHRSQWCGPTCGQGAHASGCYELTINVLKEKISNLESRLNTQVPALRQLKEERDEIIKQFKELLLALLPISKFPKDSRWSIHIELPSYKGKGVVVLTETQLELLMKLSQ